MKLLASAGLLTAAVIASATVPLPSSTTRDPDNLVVHEWGTFTSIAGEDGGAVDWLALDGSQDLPCFVERFNGFKVRLVGTVRMETPVLYFYAGRPTTVDVSVRFRQGQITEWFPRAEGPQRAIPISLASSAYESTATWRKVAITPNAPEQFPTESRSSHYYAARATDAAPVTVNGQREKFLFYRGVGRFGLPLSAAIESDGQVRLKVRAGHDRVGTVVIFENQGGKLA